MFPSQSNFFHTRNIPRGRDGTNGLNGEHPFREDHLPYKLHTTSSSASDWDDEPFTDDDLQAIEAALQSASKRPRPTSSNDDNDQNSGSRDPPTGGGGDRRRRLPSSILASQDPNTFSLSPCRGGFPSNFVFFFLFYCLDTEKTTDGKMVKFQYFISFFFLFFFF